MGDDTQRLSSLLFHKAAARAVVVIEVAGREDAHASTTVDGAVRIVIEPMAPDGAGTPLQVLHLGADPGPLVAAVLEGSPPEQAVSVLLDILPESDDVRLFFKLGADFDPDAAHSLRTRLTQSGFRLFMIDDEACTWRSVDNPFWPSDPRSNPGAAGVFYAVRDPGMIALVAVVHSTGMGGAERAHLDLVEGLVSRGHLVHTLVPLHVGPLVGELLAVGGTVSAIHGSPWLATGSAGDESWFRAAVGAEDLTVRIAMIRPDAVLTETGVLMAPSIAAQLLRLPHVWFLHERMDAEHGLHPPFEDPKSFGAEVLRRSAAVVVPSHFIGRHFFSEPSARVLAPMAPRAVEAAPAAQPPPTDGWVLGVIGSLSKAKGQEDAIRALRLLRAAGIDVSLSLYGTGPSEDYERIAAVAQECQVADHVTLEGHVDDPAVAFEACQIVLAPSRDEGFGRVPIEAIRAGSAVVYADSGGTREYMVDGLSGLAFPPGDVQAMAEAVRRLIEDAELRQNIVAQAPAVVHRWLSEHDLVVGMEDTLRQVVASSRRIGDWGDLATRRLMTHWSQEAASHLVERESLAREIDRLRNELDRVEDELDTANASLQAVRDSRWFKLGSALRHPVRAATSRQQA